MHCVEFRICEILRAILLDIYSMVMSSRRAGAKAGRELLIYLLGTIASGSFKSAEHPQQIRYLLRYGYLSGTSDRYQVTLKGAKTISEAKIWELTIPTPKVWDGKWHLVLFDIPNDKRKRRDIFRARLKELGLILYQNSVWIYPYPFEQIVREVADFYRLSPCVSFVVAKQLTGEKQLRKHFKL